MKDAINNPAPITPGGPPIMIGGQGEKKTLRLMAEHAEMANFTSGSTSCPRKLEVLAGHCEDVGRDPAHDHRTPLLASLVLAPTMEQAEQEAERLPGRPPGPGAGTASTTPPGRWWADRLLIGDADACGEQMEALLDMGLDGLTFNLPGDADDLEAVAAAPRASPPACAEAGSGKRPGFGAHRSMPLVCCIITGASRPRSGATDVAMAERVARPHG